ncbi:hypothetical protein JTE90_013677 [Oedothorax gibbosus]|uniref:Uncharacterized protein n=1 Tax=Oedothorax gibbosus TaxID=931172 RepID=A0AAV6VEB2_9ARAC|nr:hypothetical protein JTE90_013677 [Oedothorax gibbosus]
MDNQEISYLILHHPDTVHRVRLCRFDEEITKDKIWNSSIRNLPDYPRYKAVAAFRIATMHDCLNATEDCKQPFLSPLHRWSGDDFRPPLSMPCAEGRVHLLPVLGG